MSELSPSIATAGAARTAELARSGTDPVTERRRAFDRKRKRRASAKASPAESHHAPPPPELHEKSSVVAKPRFSTGLIWKRSGERSAGTATVARAVHQVSLSTSSWRAPPHVRH
jgi:hypothetical protein